MVETLARRTVLMTYFKDKCEQLTKELQYKEQVITQLLDITLDMSKKIQEYEQQLSH